MNTIISKYRLNAILEGLSGVIQRFPLVVAAWCIITALLVAAVPSSSFLDFDIVTPLVIGLVFFSLLSLNAELFCQSRSTRTATRSMVQGVLVLIGILYWYLLPDWNTSASDVVIFHGMIHAALVLSCSYAMVVSTWYQGNYQDRAFYNLCITLGLRLIQAAAIGAVAFLFGSALFATVQLLFTVDWISSDIYLQWFIVCGSLLAPLYFISSFPTILSSRIAMSDVFLSFVIRYIALPGICLYFIVLYIYSATVIANFSQWPTGIISWLVIWFAVFSYFVYVLSFHLSSEQFISWVRNSIPILLLPQIAMLFYAIILRINQHGWTINRYMVVAFGISLTIVSLYFVFRRSRSQLIFIPASLFVTIVFVTLSPWNMFTVAQQSQVQRLDSRIAQSQALEGSDAAVVLSIVEYLCTYHGCATAYTAPAFDDLIGGVAYENYWDIAKALGLGNSYVLGDTLREYYHATHNSYNTQGYSSLYEIQSWQDNTDREVYYNLDQNILIIGSQQADILDNLLAVIQTADSNGMLGNAIFSDVTPDGQPYRMFIQRLGYDGNKVFEIQGFVAR